MELIIDEAADADVGDCAERADQVEGEQPAKPCETLQLPVAVGEFVVQCEVERHGTDDRDRLRRGKWSADQVERQIKQREVDADADHSDRAELHRQVDSIAEMLRVKPYPTAEAIVNTNAIAAHEYGAQIDNPITLWDLHWVKELDDDGFIDEVIASLSKA